MPECSGKAATSSCPLTQEILKFCLAQVVQPIFFPGKSASAWETKCHSTFPKRKTQDTEWTSRDQLLAFTWMAKCFYLWQISEHYTVELCQLLLVKPARYVHGTRLHPLSSSPALLLWPDMKHPPSPDQAYFALQKEGILCLKGWTLHDR